MRRSPVIDVTQSLESAHANANELGIHVEPSIDLNARIGDDITSGDELVVWPRGHRVPPLGEYGTDWGVRWKSRLRKKIARVAEVVDGRMNYHNRNNVSSVTARGINEASSRPNSELPSSRRR